MWLLLRVIQKLTIKVNIVGAALNKGAAADAFGGLCAVTHLGGQLRRCPICNHQHPALHLLPLQHAQGFNAI